MKKAVAAAFAALSFAGVAFAETLDHWEITKVDNQAYISDGDWTFKATLRAFTMRDPATGSYLSKVPYELWVGECTGWPAAVTALDFSKPLVNNSGDGKTYLISQVSPAFGTDNGKYNENHDCTAKESGTRVGTVTFPDHAYRFEFGQYAFAGCANMVLDLKDLPTGTAQLGRDAFMHSSVTGVADLPYLTRVYMHTFHYCTGMTGLIATNVVNMGDNCMFYGCTSLKKVALGNYASLGSWVFKGCTALESVDPFVSAACADIGRGAFHNCSSLTNALVYAGTATMSNPDNNWEMFCGCSSIPSADLSAASFVQMNREFLYNCSSLQWIKFPSSLSAISAKGPRILDGLTSLQRVEFHSSVDGFLNQFPKETTALTEIHFYNCSPKETTSVLANIDASQIVTTYLHDMTDAQLAEWAACTEGGELTTSSTWSKALAGESKYLNRPLVVYAPQHAQIAAGVNAVVLSGQTGTFTVSRGDDDPVAGDLVVNYTVGGEAEAGTHYDELSGSVTIPHGESSATVSVTGRYLNETYNKSLTLTLTTGDYEIIEGKSSATISVIGGCRNVGIARVQDADFLAGQSGAFIVSRGDGDPSVGDLVVNYTASGTAVAGTDYVALPAMVTISNGQASATIPVSGLYTGSKNAKELTLTLTASDNYKIIEDKTNATISVTSGYRGVGVNKLEDANKQQGKVGSFRVSRGEDDSTNADFTVTLAYSGTATNGTTYREVPTSVTIPAGAKYVDFEIFPLDDAGVTADSTVVVSIVAGSYSAIGDPATVTIVYGNGVWGCWHIIDDSGTKKITDGVWTFNCTLQGTQVSTADAWRMDIGQATVWPDEVSPLDFSKGACYEYNNRTYKIVNWSMQFGDVSGSGNKAVAMPKEAGTKVGAVTLSDGAHESTIVEKAFAGCSNMVLDLKDLPKNIVMIGSCAFLGSSVSGGLDAPNLTVINETAFRGTAITSFRAPKLTTIKGYAFYSATGLKTVDLGPDSDCVLTSIGQYAFYGCSALENFTPFLPSSLDVLNVRAVFMECASLTNALVFKGSNLGEEYTGWGGTQLFRNCAKIPSADLSESTITAIRREVFYGCASLRDVKLPSTFVEFGNPKTAIDSKEYYSNINQDPFMNCAAIKLYINSGEMPNKNSSTDVTIPMDIPEVTEMVIGVGVTNLEAGAFSKAEYSGLTKITFLGAKPATIGTDIFAGQKTESITAYVPFKYVESWKPVADDGNITSTSGTWTSGTTQKIRTKRGLIIFFE